MKNVKVNGVNYSGVSQVQLALASGGTALFKDVDEITTSSGDGLPVYTGEYTITNANTQKKIAHNLNLSSYLCIYWDANMTEYIAGTETSGAKVMCGFGAFNFDLGLDSAGKAGTSFVFSKGYNQSSATWSAGNGNDSANVAQSHDENNFYMPTTISLRSTTYKWVIVDLSSLNAGGA